MTDPLADFTLDELQALLEKYMRRYALSPADKALALRGQFLQGVVSQRMIVRDVCADLQAARVEARKPAPRAPTLMRI